MYNKSDIEGTDYTGNPVKGCSKISKGCANCYAAIIAYKKQAEGKDMDYINGFDVTLRHRYLCSPTFTNPRRIFVCSMSDLFHDSVPFEFIDKVMTVIKSNPMHTWQILTKRAKRMAQYFEKKSIPPNAGLGVSVENKNVMNRIDYLRNLNATVKFLSCEPLLEDLEVMNLKSIDGIIVGGESEDWENRNRIRQMKKEWVLSIKNQCDEQNIAFFFKQWGMYGEDGKIRTTEDNGSKGNGKIYHAMPEVDVMTANGLLF